MKYFGFFKGMNYGNCKDNFDDFKTIRNEIPKTEVLKYIKKLPIAAVAPMSVEDIFDGQDIEQAGIIEDGDFTFPLEFIHYYEKYDIGIPKEYENYIATKI